MVQNVAADLKCILTLNHSVLLYINIIFCLIDLHIPNSCTVFSLFFFKVMLSWRQQGQITLKMWPGTTYTYSIVILTHTLYVFM